MIHRAQRRPLHVLFLCTGNSARSIIAECLLRQLGGEAFAAFSAGSFPKGEVHPLTLRLLAEQGLSTADLRPKSWRAFGTPDSPLMDFVFTVCDHVAGESCPTWPGQPVTADWGIPDPAAVDGSNAERMLAFRAAFRTLEQRLKLFVSLPIGSLDRVALTTRVAVIGRLRNDTVQERAS